MVQCRAGAVVTKVATVKIPAVLIIFTWLSSFSPLSKFTRRILAEGPAGLKMTVSWPPAYSNQTAVDFIAELSATGALGQAVDADPILKQLGPAQVPARSISVIQNFAPPPPALAQNPLPPAPLGNQPMSPENPEAPKDTKDPFQVSFSHTESVVT